VAQDQFFNQTETVVAQTPEEKANLERFDKLDFEAWNIEIGHSLERYTALMY
jgi:hypothetical protein